MKKRKFTITQMLAVIFIVLYLVWERNIQLYLDAHDLENTFKTRKDLFVIIPLLLILIVGSIIQWRKNKKNKANSFRQSL